MLSTWSKSAVFFYVVLQLIQLFFASAAAFHVIRLGIVVSALLLYTVLPFLTTCLILAGFWKDGANTYARYKWDAFEFFAGAFSSVLLVGTVAVCHLQYLGRDTSDSTVYNSYLTLQVTAALTAFIMLYFGLNFLFSWTFSAYPTRTWTQTVVENKTE